MKAQYYRIARQHKSELPPLTVFGEPDTKQPIGFVEQITASDITVVLFEPHEVPEDAKILAVVLDRQEMLLKYREANAKSAGGLALLLALDGVHPLTEPEGWLRRLTNRCRTFWIQRFWT